MSLPVLHVQPKTHLDLPENLTFEQWEEYGPALARIHGGVMWWVGDWLNYGERSYGEKYAQALDSTDWEYQTLRDAAWLASKFDVSRRRDILTWSHHREVAALPPEDADALLDEAEEEGWSTRALRNAVKRRKRVEKETALIPPDPPSHRIIHAEILEADVETGSVDAIITDPPYPEEFLPCYTDLGVFARRVLRPGGVLIAMVGQSYLPEVMRRLGEHLDYHWCSAYLTPGGQAVQLWQRNVNTFWKPLLWYVTGKYNGKWVGDVTKSDVNDNDKTLHEWGQSASGMIDVVRRFTEPGQVVCDPFMGAGTTGIAALANGCSFIGIDRDPRAVEAAAARLRVAA